MALHAHISPGGRTIGPFVVAVLRHSLTQHNQSINQPIIMTFLNLDTLHYFSIVKSKATPLHAMEALGGERHSSYSFTTSALDGGEWSVCCIPYPRAGGPVLAPGSRMRWPSGLPMRLAVRRELAVLRRVVVNPHRLRNSSYLMYNFI
jgi:hypothetical protein